MTDGYISDIDFFLQAYDMKDKKRVGWKLRNVQDPESIADHTWGMTLLILRYGKEKDIDMEKALKIAVVHDLAESITGDIASREEKVKQRISKEEKEEMERKAMDELHGYLDDEDIKRLWEEYEERESKEARFVKDMDKIDMSLQALKYEEERRYDKEEDNPNFDEYDDLDEFFVNAGKNIFFDETEKLFEEIRSRYERMK